ncbi:LysR family transcriptional regulator [Pelagibius sp. Alg239-R121]|uniref:LysR family transcriptional regulator n=1 Tax=Pelagibius sp. Alg239-R121 TaxID=2993448 RepID=UPI0024A72D3A|nr:LysR family transcriptional regulator [Pelagibius sp. Alg239-R121]
MNLDHIWTFLEVAATGNFNRAAENLNVTQSTVSGRIKTLEENFGRPLLVRSHNGCVLTSAGHQFRQHAIGMQRLWQQSHQAVTLRPGYRSVLSVGAQVSLWERLILDWIPWMRDQAPDVALRIEADYSPSQMRQLADGLLDIGVMYQPRQAPGLVIEKLLEEALVLVATDERRLSPGWIEDYVYVDWGDVFRTQHAEAFPEMETAAISVGLGALGLQHILHRGGSGYFPRRAVQPLIDEGRLIQLSEAPVISRPAYVVYRKEPEDPETQALALNGLRDIAAIETS